MSTRQRPRVLPSPEEIIAGRTGNGGWKRSVLEQWGVPWPPPKGWRRQLEDEWYSSQKISRRSLPGKDQGSQAVERPGPLDRDRRYISPVKAAKRFEELKALFDQTVWGQPMVREWKKGSMMRLYFRDESYIYIDATGAVGSSGGLATKAKFENRLV
jgi:hypothetical protein